MTILAIVLIFGTLTPNTNHNAFALTHSIHVAYITDFGAGISDGAGPGAGSSILRNAVNGIPILSGGIYTTPAPSSNAVTITDVSVSTVDAGGVGAIAGFDTVMLYMVCDIGSHPGLMTALNSYLTSGLGKVVIFDGDRCSPIAAGSAVYSTFLFPFTSSNPGPGGFAGPITFVETESVPATLTRGVSLGPLPGLNDAIGDSNTFTTFDPNWCDAISGTNGLAVSGIQVGYARTSTNGLVIYNGQDTWFTFGPNAYDKKVFDNILDQPFTPDSLPCGRVATGITLTPHSATNAIGASHTVMATVTDNTGAGLAGITVTFTVTSGPNAGKTGTGVTDASGVATFTYSDTGGGGTDNIQASFNDATGALHKSNIATKLWGTGSIAPVGGIIIPVDMTALFVAGMMTNAFWVLPTVGGIAGAAIALFKVKRKHE